MLLQPFVLLDVFNEIGETHEAIPARAQVLEVPSKNGGIVATDAEIRRGEAVKKENACAAAPKRSENGKADIARDCR
jgi:hypothetical protein